MNEICQKLQTNPHLKGGFTGIGLSQGGLMMRALVETCDNIDVIRLITFGSPLLGKHTYDYGKKRLTKESHFRSKCLSRMRYKVSQMGSGKMGKGNTSCYPKQIITM